MDDYAKTSAETPPEELEPTEQAEPQADEASPPPEATEAELNGPPGEQDDPEPEAEEAAAEGDSEPGDEEAAAEDDPEPEEEEASAEDDPEPEEEEAAAETDPAPAPAGRRNARLAAAGLLLLALAVLAWFLIPGRPESGGHEETAALAQFLAPVIRAESLDPERLERAARELAERSPQSPAARELASGAAAFLRDELPAAHQHFDAAAALDPDLPDLISFRAAASLRQGNPALAGDLYRRALSLKTGLNYPPLELAADQLGLALSLFFLQRPAEALPLAEEAWLTRSRELGLGSPETLSAANRLATIQVALGQPGLAEEILKAAYRGALAGQEADAALEETRLLLTVLHNQSGRLEELEDFFRQDPPAEAARPKDGPEASPGPPLPPATAENLAEWAGLAAGLESASPGLAADLRLRILQGREVRQGRDRHQPELRADLMALARAYLAAGRYERALEELRPLEESIGRDSEGYVQYAALLGQALAGRGQLKAAEAQWQAAAELVGGRIAARIKDRKNPDPADVAQSLDLHLKLADLFLQQGRVPQEAEIELLAALGALDRLGPKTADNYPDTARVYLRLARLMWEMGQTRSSADFYRRARALAEDLGPRAEPAQKAFLANTARLAAREAEALAAKGPRPGFPSEMGPAEAELPSPDILRLELSALAALGRRAEFQERLEPALKEAARRYGQSSQYYMRYYSLKLKGLEEEGRLDDLTAELRRQADQPPGRNDAERALNRGSALIYAARANEKAGRPAEAVKLYEEALAAISGREEDIIAARRRAVEEALERLKN